MAKSKKPANGESISGYFRKVFTENPRLLKGKSNEELLRRWLADHPGEKEVPKNVKANLSNIKSVLRKKGRKADKKAARDAAGSVREGQPVARSPRQGTRLEMLEEQIDDCLSLAKHIDREGLSHVISMLRGARNAVVWMTGQ